MPWAPRSNIWLENYETYIYLHSRIIQILLCAVYEVTGISLCEKVWSTLAWAVVLWRIRVTLTIRFTLVSRRKLKESVVVTRLVIAVTVEENIQYLALGESTGCHHFFCPLDTVKEQPQAYKSAFKQHRQLFPSVGAKSSHAQINRQVLLYISNFEKYKKRLPGNPPASAISTLQVCPAICRLCSEWVID